MVVFQGESGAIARAVTTEESGYQTSGRQPLPSSGKPLGFP